MLPGRPAAKDLLGGKSYDSNHLRQALIERGIEPRIPSCGSRKILAFASLVIPSLAVLLAFG
jgi:hypothetical protein